MTRDHLPTPFEQEMLELLNRARLDPQGEARNAVGDDVSEDVLSAMAYFGTDIDAYLAQVAALEPVAPLAWNGRLTDAATGHNDRLIAEQVQLHQFPGGPTIAERFLEAGYAFSSGYENVYSYTEDPVHGHAGFFIDWGYDAGEVVDGVPRADFRAQGDGIQDPAGHRVAIMSPAMTEVGMAAREADPDGRVGPWVVTQNFGTRSDYAPQLVGVAFDDADGDAFYDMGEGLGGVTVTATGLAGTYTTTTWASGGYQMALPDGHYTVSFSGAAFPDEVVSVVRIAGANAKLDADAAASGPAGAPIMTMGTPASETIMPQSEDVAEVVIGGGGSDVLTDAAGRCILIGDGFVAGHFDEADAVFRMYAAALGRAPDLQGYDAWTQRMVLGLSEEELAAAFTDSLEFLRDSGGLADAAFVEQLYMTVLERAPDAGSATAWAGRLADGMTRAEVVAGFAGSQEFIARTRDEADRFAAQADPAQWVDDVFGLYRALLGRDPDDGGLVAWSGELARGSSYLDIVERFIASPEFQTVYGAQDDAGFIALLYGNVLGRAPDPMGLESWTGRLEAGAARAEIVGGFLQSPEFADISDPALTRYLRELGTDDTLIYHAGADMLAGGILADTFVFAEGAMGRTRIVDFEPWDSLSLSNSVAGSPEDVRDAMEQRGADTVLSLDGLEITLADVRAADLTDDQFIFV
jgi:uncharacterized protein YkwD